MTLLSRTCTKPPCTAASSHSPSVLRMRTMASSRAPRNGAWSARKAMSPPPTVRQITISASPLYRIRSGETSSTCMAIALRLALAFLLLAVLLVVALPAFLLGERLGLLPCAVGVADVEEGLLGQVVELAVDQLLEGLDGLLHRDVDALEARELLAHEERLGEELLHLAGPLDDDLVLFGELVEPEDGDDVLQLLIALQDLLHAPGDRVVVLADDLGRQDPARRRQRVDGRVDAERRDLAGELGGGVEVGERGERGRVGEVVGGHVDRLQRGDRPALGGGDALLQLAHLVGEGGLVTHGRGH